MINSCSADEFLSTVLFIDDEAVKKTEDNIAGVFNFKNLANKFASRGKLCTFFSPEKQEDLKTCIELADKADVTILDWFINLPISDDIDSAEDVPSDIRGLFATDFLLNVLQKCRNQLKLFLIYTNESIEAVFNDAYNKLCEKEKDIVKDDSEDYLLKLQSIKIYFRKKNTELEPNGKSLKGLLDAEEVPEFIINKFSKMNHGFLPEFALKCASVIKENIFEILNLFSADMDYAYFNHKFCIQDAESSLSILFNLYCNVLNELLFSQSEDFSSIEKGWIVSYVKDENEYGGKKESKQQNFAQESCSSNERLKNACIQHFACKELIKDDTKLDAFVKFAKLTHLCADFSINATSPRILTLGTVISDIENTACYLCIQQRCDSVRINGEERKFLFLPLERKEIKTLTANSNKKISIIFDKQTAFKIKNKSFDIFTIQFQGNKDCVKSEYINNNWIFTDCNKRKYKYLGRVNEMHSLKIVRTYGETLSRIGLDDFEWFRQLGK